MSDKNTPPVNRGEEMGRKLSVKELGFGKEAITLLCLQAKGVDHFLMRVLGTVTSLKPYKSRQKNDDGEEMEGYGLLGTFRCTSANGEEKSGNLLYLPGFVVDQITAGLQSAAPDETVSADIAIDVFARYAEDSPTSYQFVCRSLIPSDTSAVDRIAAMIGNAPLPALPAPGKAS